MENEIKSVCFTGHREIPDDRLLRKRLIELLLELTKKGAVDFYAGGALGFDMLCEKAVLRLKEKYTDIRLHLLLPCPADDQISRWSEDNRSVFRRIYSAADEHIIVSPAYTKSCMKQRNQLLVDSADCCVCYYTEQRSGTGQTVRMAEKKGIPVINLAASNSDIFYKMY